LEGVWGLGPKGALKLYQRGIHSIEELRERQDELLTDIQKIGLKYYEDFN
jgi:5'-3' exonuclease